MATVLRSRFVFAAIVLIFLGCKGDTGPVGPAGPALSGSMTGFVTLLQSDGSRPSDMSGTHVSIDGTSYATLTDASGKWTIQDVKAGIYSLTISKQGYGTYHDQNRQFTGGGTLYLGRTPLSQPPDFTVSLDETKTGADTGGITVALAFNGGYPGYRRAIIMIGSTANMSPADPNSWTYSASIATSSQTYSIRLYRSDLQYAGLTSGQTAYVATFPLQYGSSLDYSNYLDQSTGKTVWTAAGPKSQVVQVTVP